MILKCPFHLSLLDYSLKNDKMYLGGDTMPFREIIGQDLATQQLQQALQNKRLAHAYLFTGPEGVGKSSTALALARTLLSPQDEPLSDFALQNHPDFHHLYPDGNSIKINQIRTLKEALSKYSQVSTTSIVLMEEAETMGIASANALLKTLEEPLGNVLFILLTAHEDRLPKTILSRVQRVIFRPLAPVQLKQILEKEAVYQEAGELEQQLAVQLAAGSLVQARAFLQQEGHSYLADRAQLFTLFQRLTTAHPGECLLYTKKLKENWQADLDEARERWQIEVDQLKENNEDPTALEKALHYSDRYYLVTWVRLQVLFLQQFLKDLVSLQCQDGSSFYHPDFRMAYFKMQFPHFPYHETQEVCQNAYRQLESNSDPFLVLAVLLQKLAQLLS